jgi:hypothetical protein
VSPLGGKDDEVERPRALHLEPRLPAPPRRVTAIILAWNRWDLTEKCIRTFQETVDPADAQLLVVDNGSSDETPQRLGQMKGLRTIRNAKNLGFVRGNNVGIAAADPSTVYSGADLESCSSEPLRQHDLLIAFQAADGSWELSRALAKVVGRRLRDLKAEARSVTDGSPVAIRAFSTAIALAWLAARAADASDEWGMLADKALGWLAGCGSTPTTGESWQDVGQRVVRSA